VAESRVAKLEKRKLSIWCVTAKTSAAALLIPDVFIVAVFQVTGKATQEYFFDPSLLLPLDDNGHPKPTSSVLSSPRQQGLETAAETSFFASKHLFVPCTIIKPLSGDESNNKNKQQQQPFAGPTLVKTNDGVLHKITDSTKLLPLTASDYQGVNDVLHLQSVSEAALVHTLKQRYKQNKIYTSAGSILMSINPYTTLPGLYDTTTMQKYRTHTASTKPPPHLFQTADAAYSALMQSMRGLLTTTRANDNNDSDEMDGSMEHSLLHRVTNQSIIISGESGAGKVRR